MHDSAGDFDSCSRRKPRLSIRLRRILRVRTTRYPPLIHPPLPSFLSFPTRTTPRALSSSLRQRIHQLPPSTPPGLRNTSFHSGFLSLTRVPPRQHHLSRSLTPLSKLSSHPSSKNICPSPIPCQTPRRMRPSGFCRRGEWDADFRVLRISSLCPPYQYQ